MTSSKAPVAVAVFLSGGGRSLQNLIDYQRKGILGNIEFQLAISSRDHVGPTSIFSMCRITCKPLHRSDMAHTRSIITECLSLVFNPVHEQGCNRAHHHVPLAYRGHAGHVLTSSGVIYFEHFGRHRLYILCSLLILLYCIFAVLITMLCALSAIPVCIHNTVPFAQLSLRDALGSHLYICSSPNREVLGNRVLSADG